MQGQQKALLTHAGSESQEVSYLSSARQGNGVLMHPRKTIVIAQTVHHMLKATSGGRFRIPGKGNQVFVDLIRVDLLWQPPEMKYEQSDATNVIL